MAHWYLIAYDISDDKRRRRVHRYLRQHSHAAQRSVFVAYASKAKLDSILQGLTPLIAKQHDDLRCYPIYHPNQLWVVGPHPIDKSLITPAKDASLPKRWIDRVKEWIHV